MSGLLQKKHSTPLIILMIKWREKPHLVTFTLINKISQWRRKPLKTIQKLLQLTMSNCKLVSGVFLIWKCSQTAFSYTTFWDASVLLESKSYNSECSAMYLLTVFRSKPSSRAIHLFNCPLKCLLMISSLSIWPIISNDHLQQHCIVGVMSDPFLNWNVGMRWGLRWDCWTKFEPKAYFYGPHKSKQVRSLCHWSAIIVGRGGRIWTNGLRVMRRWRTRNSKEFEMTFRRFICGYVET